MAFSITNNQQTRSAVWDVLEEPDGVLTAISSISDALDGFIPRLAPGAMVLLAVMGDSLSSAQSADSNKAWGWANLLSHGSLVRSGTGWSAGVGGNTTAQMVARLNDVLLLDPKPHICIVQGGTNDALTAVPLATTTANLVTMYNAIEAAGIEPVVCLIPPSDTQPARVNQINSWIATYAMMRGMRCLDNYTPAADPDGTWRSGYSSDGTHPNATGAKPMGVAGAATLATGRSIEALLAGKSGTDTTNLILNGLFTGDTNADGLANDWTLTAAGANVAPTLEAGTGNVLGNWQIVSKTLAAAGNNYINPAATITTGFAAGDLMLFCGRVRFTNTDGNHWLDLRVHDTPNVAVNPIMFQWFGELATDDGAIFSQLFRVPAGTTAFSPRALGRTTNGTGSFAVAQMTLRNLTALGVA